MKDNELIVCRDVSLGYEGRSILSGLDPAAAQDLYKTRAYLNQKEGMAIVMVTHDLQNALKYATHILHAGHKGWFFGTAAEYLASPYGKKFGGDGV